jgi:hypothetical protein
MFKWLLSLLALLFPFTFSGDTDYTGDVAAEAAYASMLPTGPAVKPKVPTKDCTTCNGTGRVRTGDDQGWTKCPDCEGVPASEPAADEPEPAPTVKTPKSEPERYLPRPSEAPTSIIR